MFWSVVIDPVPFRGTLSYGARLPYLLVLGAAQNTVLGGILSFSSRLLYTAYEQVPVFDLDRVTDQRVGGAIMWVVGDFVFLAAASGRLTGCILLDLWMPGMDGLEVQTRLRRMGILLPVIVMTAGGDVQTDHGQRQLGPARLRGRARLPRRLPLAEHAGRAAAGEAGAGQLHSLRHRAQSFIRYAVGGSDCKSNSVSLNSCDEAALRSRSCRRAQF